MIAISTACKEALIGIDIGGEKKFKSLDSSCKHSENVLFMIDKLLDEMGKSVAENDNYAVVVGPGSFTGLRIGISLIKGLCASEEKNNVAIITTFDLMAYSYIKNFQPQTDFTCIINGLGGYYFVCKYSCNGEKLTAEKMIDESEVSLQENLVGLKEDDIFEKNVSPSAEELLQLALEKTEKCEMVSAQKLSPLYLRKSQAESGLENKK